MTQPALQRVRGWFTGSLRRQLVWGVALVHAVMMTLFVWDLSHKQRAFLLDSQVQQAGSLAQTLALASQTGLITRDMAGLQELAQAQQRYPGLDYAMLLDARGQVLAHTDSERRGQYVTDLAPLGGAATGLRIAAERETLVDALMPVVVHGKTMGWARVGLTPSDTAARLESVTTSGFVYTALAIAIGVLIAWVMAARLTRPLRELSRVTRAVRSGTVGERASDLGSDEISELGHDFNAMLDALDDKQRQSQELRQALQAEKDQAEVTLASIGDAVVTTDTQGAVVFMNPVAAALTGWPLAEAWQRPLSDILTLETTAGDAAAPDFIALALQRQDTVTFNEPLRLRSRSGEACDIESTAAPVRLKDGQTVGCVLVFRDVSERQRLLRDVNWRAGHDVLTGLPNRALLADRFALALAQARRHQHLLGVCMLDLDRFKPINDLHGHGVGDLLLIEVTRRLQQMVRDEDTIARLGGDEFVLLLGGLKSTDEMAPILRRVLQQVAEPYLINGLTLEVSASMGVAVYPQDDADPDTLLRHADHAMYDAKQAGRNAFAWFDVVHEKRAIDTQQLLKDIDLALQRNELTLHYQPKVNMQTGAVTGLEALLRWQHPSRGLLPPLDFLPLLESTDRMVPIGEWVIRQALAQSAAWAAEGLQLPVSVNLSARHFQMPDFLVRLQALLTEQPRLPLHSLDLEILESAALADLDKVRELIEACQRLGVTFSLDDFGTGYSSLSYLKQLPANTLKIDQSFVRDMLDDPDDMALVEAVIGLATAFGRNLVAEGVETVEHGVLLMRLGCEQAQGYGISRPLPPEQVPGWVRAWRPPEDWGFWAEVQWPLIDLPLILARRDHRRWFAQCDAHWSASAPTDSGGASPLAQRPERFSIWFEHIGRWRYGHTAPFAALDGLYQTLPGVEALLEGHHLANTPPGAASSAWSEWREWQTAVLGQLATLERLSGLATTTDKD